MRSTDEVLRKHLAYRRALDLESDLQQNYADDVVVLSWGEGVHRGFDGVRTLAGVLQTYLPEGNYRYDDLIVADAYGLLRWSGTAPGGEQLRGVDSFVVTDGRITAQTISYVAG
ncbi:nuclear transport factor 2 family protein [Promicromonospora sp. NPDC023987]|uniref:nuclear transport factor 2 family protein n=1 Tax=Promicromonospora sp. NPDC023987 TaxID=3155360 RepID=UPI0033FF22D4